jgi:DNA-binding NarL/FixJ family response regulator
VRSPITAARASSGTVPVPASAFGLVVEHRLGVVVMDIRLKNGADGLHADAMRSLYKTPIVFCTGYGDPETIWRIRRFGRTECCSNRCGRKSCVTQFSGRPSLKPSRVDDHLFGLS